ncbi:MAG: TAXI family TRAP transporter solute-binding subunit [Candidatus Nezhaarchaeales archaeon]
MAGRRALWIGVVVVIAIVIIAAAYFAYLAPKPVPGPKRFTIASGWVVGVYYPVAGAMSRIIYEHVPGMSLTVESSGASVANAKLIGSGAADFAILQNDIAYYAYNGILMFEGAPIKNMRGIAILYPEHIQIVARADAGIKSVSDLKGKRVAVGPLGSGTEVNARQILEVYGLTFDDLGKAERLSAEEASSYLKDGRVDAAFFTVGVGAAAISDVALLTPITLVPIEEAKIEALRAKYPYYFREVIPAGSYKGVDKDVVTVAVYATLVCRGELSTDDVYTFTKAIFEHISTLHAAHARAKAISLEKAIIAMPIPLHPGAEKYYREKGVLKG